MSAVKLRHFYSVGFLYGVFMGDKLSLRSINIISSQYKPIIMHTTKHQTQKRTHKQTGKSNTSSHNKVNFQHVVIFLYL